MCMGGSPKAPTPAPAAAPEPVKPLTTPDQSAADSVSGTRQVGASRKKLRIDLGGGSQGSGLNLPTG